MQARPCSLGLMWTPMQPPPHPSLVPTVSTLAQKMLDLIEQECNGRTRSTIPHNPSNEIETLFCGGRDTETPNKTLTNDPGSKSKYWSSHATNHKTAEQETSSRDTFTSTTPANYLSSQKNKHDAEFNFHTTNIVSQNTDHRNQCFEMNEAEIPQTINSCEQLSPDMEFDNINIYSIGFDESQRARCSVMFSYTGACVPNKTLPANSHSRVNQGSINFKEIKRNPLQKTRELSKICPSDQTFIFENKPKTTKFQSKLNRYRVVDKKETNNAKITSYFKPLEGSNDVTEILNETHANDHRIFNFENKQGLNDIKNKIFSETENNNLHKITDIRNEDIVNNYQVNNIVQMNNKSNEEHVDFNYAVLNKTNDDSNTGYSMSESLDESLFVDTQELQLKKNKCKFENMDICTDLSELVTNQIQDVSSKSHIFDIDDLFSSDSVVSPTHHTNRDVEMLMPCTVNEDNIFEQRRKDGSSTNLQVIRENSRDMFNMNSDGLNKTRTEIFMTDSYVTEAPQYKSDQKDTGKNVYLIPKEKEDKGTIIENKGANDKQRNQDSVELNVKIVDGRLVTKSINHSCNTNQLTNTNTNAMLDNKINKPNNKESELFKKPLLPFRKTIMKTNFVSGEQNITEKNKQSNKSKCELNFKSTKINSNTISQKATVDSTSNTKKLVQTTLKNTIITQNKTKKKCRFIPPVLSQETHQNTSDNEPDKYKIIILDEVNANKILKRLTDEIPQKVLITVTFKEGYTLLNKPSEPLKKSHCLPSGVMFLVHWSVDRSFYYWLPLQTVSHSAVHDIVQTLLSRPEQITCFESQAVFMLLKDVFHYQNISKWVAHDPLIGCWLLDPDNPPKDFAEVALQLKIDKNLFTVNAKDDTKTQACKLLPALDKVMDLLTERLQNDSLWTVFSEMETKLTPVLAMMECSSILIDVKTLNNNAHVLSDIVRQLEKEAHHLAGRPFQLNSHKQLREILFNEMKLDQKFNITVKQTEQGSKSTSEAVLSQLKDLHPLPNCVLEYRRLQKVKSTYVDGLIQHVKPDNTISTVWEQVGAATGRITSKNPNLQAVPKTPVVLKDGDKIYLRAVFQAREGFSFLAADFQQIEFRVFSHFTGDNMLLQAFREGEDIFQQLAAQWLGDKEGEQREKTKRIVYSIMYGAGPQLLAEYLHVDLAEASRLIKNFTDIYPCLRSLPQKVVSQCRTNGFITTLSGRRRLFPNIRSTNWKLRAYSERQAINFLVQGSAADICKAAMLDCEAAIRERSLNARLLLQIHDELVWEVQDENLWETARVVRESMEHRWEDRLTLRVPVPVSISTGKTLADMKLVQ